MESRFYTCKYCFKEFEPKRRRVQKYCSDTCRNKAHHAKKPKHVLPIPKEENLPVAELKPDIQRKNKSVTIGGVGESFLGAFAYDASKEFFKPKQNRAATKKDILELKSLIVGERYLPITNMYPNQFGQNPYYDIETQEVVYL